MRRSSGGFTLIEILMAMMVLAVGLASVLSVFVVGLRASRDVIDESASAVAAKAVLARVLSEDVDPDNVYGRRDFLKQIEEQRRAPNLAVWIWMVRDPVSDDNPNPPIEILSGVAGDSPPDEAAIPDPKPIAENSVFSWRCRASRHRGEAMDPTQDLLDGADPVPMKSGRIPATQDQNPDSDELWRLTIQIYRDFKQGRKPLTTFDTYVCTAHR